MHDADAIAVNAGVFRHGAAASQYGPRGQVELFPGMTLLVVLEEGATPRYSVFMLSCEPRDKPMQAHCFMHAEVLLSLPSRHMNRAPQALAASAGSARTLDVIETIGTCSPRRRAEAEKPKKH